MHISPLGLFDPHLKGVMPATAFGFIALEYGLSRLTHQDVYDWRESAATLGMAGGRILLRSLSALLVATPFAFVWQHRLLNFDSRSAPALLALFLGGEFLYYWHHRLSHSVRWLWATHSVHHSTTRLNLSAAMRLAWTGNIAGNFLFALPLVWIGFHPFAVSAMLGFNLFYQFFIHTELIPSLGPLERVLNTPAHHRVHHAANASCLDRNFGGILIVFDRLFGSFARTPENEPLRYGILGGKPSFNPLRIAFGEWAAMLRDVWSAPKLPQKFTALVRFPAGSATATSSETSRKPLPSPKLFPEIQSNGD